MDKKKAREFVKELNKLQEKYGLTLSARFQEEFDYDYDENLYSTGGYGCLVITDEKGFDIDLDDLENGRFSCYYCGRDVDVDNNFCNRGCEEKYKLVEEKKG